ncbi:YARHG domain-containing protein [Marinifilum caeruleilacunae]|uniref:YARHG domain-containing protein n=1 Tax=Marinifilum caeruleilacunae TaxID=2499076 RepID=A0ABX1X0S2_9BACT|nr:YARHG domain-containing protein [Marinifilum caeruleilacunae]NOU62009.1 YARHG domain-containing protein [Marinifilum caeruleilacunae]
MRLILILNILLLPLYSFGQKDDILSTWTNGYEFYSASRYQDSLILCTGGNLHEGGYMFALRQIDTSFFQFTDCPFEDFHPSIGNKFETVNLSIINGQKVLIINSKAGIVREVLIELNSSLEELIIQNKVNYELSGKYVDDELKHYGFYPNKQSAYGFDSTEIYKFEYEFDIPANYITFESGQTYYYEQTEKGLDIYGASCNENDYWTKGDKIKSLRRVEYFHTTNNKNLFGNYPFASTTILLPSILEKFSKVELRIMRNEIFARHAYIFKSNKMKSHFTSQDWYQGKAENVNSKLSDLEKLNIKLISWAERNR